jgi:hypothetical protein
MPMSDQEHFTKWWTEKGSSAAEQGEALARLGWDAAIRAAVVLLDDEVRRLVEARQYELAAEVRDCRERIEWLFTTPGQWSVEQRITEERIKRATQMFRGLTAQQLEEVRRVYSPGTPEAIALAAVLGERESGTGSLPNGKARQVVRPL